MTEADGSRSNVTMIGYMPEDEGFSIDDYWEMCRMQYEDALPSFTVLSANAEGEPGGEAGKIGDRQAKLYLHLQDGRVYLQGAAGCLYLFHHGVYCDIYGVGAAF